MFKLQKELESLEEQKNILNKLHKDLDSINCEIDSIIEKKNSLLDNEENVIHETINKLKLKKRDLVLEIKSYGNIDNKYSNLISKKKDYILSSSTDDKENVISLIKEQNITQIEVKEIEEAYYQGEIFRPFVIKIKNSLEEHYKTDKFDHDNIDLLIKELVDGLNKYYAELDDLSKCATSTIDKNNIIQLLEYIKNDVLRIYDKNSFENVLGIISTIDHKTHEIQYNLREKYAIYNKKNDELINLIEAAIIAY